VGSDTAGGGVDVGEEGKSSWACSSACSSTGSSLIGTRTGADSVMAGVVMTRQLQELFGDGSRSLVLQWGVETEFNLTSALIYSQEERNERGMGEWGNEDEFWDERTEGKEARARRVSRLSSRTPYHDDNDRHYQHHGRVIAPCHFLHIHMTRCLIGGNRSSSMPGWIDGV